LHKKIKSLIRTTFPVFQHIGHGKAKIAVDENCLLKRNNHAFILHFLPTPFFGNILLLGNDPKTGDFKDLGDDMDIIYLAQNITYFEKAESKKMQARYRAYSAKLNGQ